MQLDIFGLADGSRILIPLILALWWHLWMWFIWFSMVLLGLRWWNGSSIWQEVLFVLVILFSWLLYCQFRVCWSFAAHLGDNGFLAGFGTLLIVYKCMLCGYWSILSFLIFRHWARFVASARDYLLCCPWLVILLRCCLLLSFESIREVCILWRLWIFDSTLWRWCFGWNVTQHTQNYYLLRVSLSALYKLEVVLPN